MVFKHLAKRLVDRPPETSKIKFYKVDFNGLCFEFSGLKKIYGNDFDELPDETMGEDRVVFQVLQLRQTKPYQA